MIKPNKTKWISIFLIITMLFTLLPSAAIAGEQTGKEAIRVELTGPVYTDATDLTVNISAQVPADSRIVVKMFGENETEVTPFKGTLVGAADAKQGTTAVVLQKNAVLVKNQKLVAFVLAQGTLVGKSAPVLIQESAGGSNPVLPPDQGALKVVIPLQTITEGDTNIRFKLNVEQLTSPASYRLYQFQGSTLNPETDQVLASGTLYSNGIKTVNGLEHKLIRDSRLQVGVTIKGEDYFSNTVTVGASPDWGTPTVAMDAVQVEKNVTEVPVVAKYDDAYQSLGERFYCDISVYKFPETITEGEFRQHQMWNGYPGVVKIAQVNSRNQDITKGHLKLALKPDVKLEAGDRVIAVMLLPHSEWEGSGVNYISGSIPVTEVGEYVPKEQVLLYNLEDKTSRGHRLLEILKEHHIAYKMVTYKELNETIGFLCGYPEFEEVAEDYSGEDYKVEFMLMNGFSETRMDEFLGAMMENGLRINNKATVTNYTKELEMYDLIERIGKEDATFKALINLNEMVQKAKKLQYYHYGTHPNWGQLQNAIKEAEYVLKTYEPPLEDLTRAYENLKEQYLLVTGQEELKGSLEITVTPEKNGLYTMQAKLKGSQNDAQVKYVWRDKTTGNTVKDVRAEDLIGMTVTATAENYYGKYTSQLNVPDMPKANATVKGTRVELEIEPAELKANQMSVESYQIIAKEQGTVVKTMSVDSKTGRAVLEGLKEKTDYDLTVAAYSAVGRSTLQEMTVHTESGMEPEAPDFGGGGGGGFFPVEPQSKVTVISPNQEVEPTAEEMKTDTFMQVKKYADQITGLRVIGSEAHAACIRATKDGKPVQNMKEPMRITVPVEKEVLSTVKSMKHLTMAEVKVNENGSVVLEYVSGAYDSKTGSFHAWADHTGDYVLVEKDDLIQISMKVGDKKTLLNGQEKTMDVAPVIEKNRTMIPLRYVGETLGCDVDWDNETRSITITGKALILKMTVDKEIPGFGAAPIIRNGRTLVPIRYVSEALRANVLYSPMNQSIRIIQ